MKNVYVRIIIFIALFFAAYSIYFTTVDYFLNKHNKNSNAVYIWGDSQVCQAIDFEQLSEQMERQVLSAGWHASDVYDFLVFAQKVPENADVILGMSYGMLLRGKENAYNRSGLSLKALYYLFRHHYSIFDIGRTLQLNIGINRLYPNFSVDYGVTDSADLSNLETLANNFTEVPEYLEDKTELFMLGLKALEDKGCSITMLDLPFHEEIQDVLDSSEAVKMVNEFRREIIQDFSLQEEYIRLPSDGNFMFDVPHLNSRGRTIVTKDLAQRYPLLAGMNNYLYYELYNTRIKKE